MDAGKNIKNMGQRNGTSLNNQIETKNYRIRPDNGGGGEVLERLTLHLFTDF